MTNLPWHFTVATDRPLYHDELPEAQTITLKNRRPGDGGRDPCPHCAQLLVETIAARLRGPVLPETDVHRCPACHSDRIAPAEHVIVSGEILVRREYQCAACGGTFWVRADGAPPNAPSDAI